METTNRRSESPAKTKSKSAEILENNEGSSDDISTNKMSTRSRHKALQSEKETDGFVANGNSTSYDSNEDQCHKSNGSDNVSVENIGKQDTSLSSTCDITTEISEGNSVNADDDSSKDVSHISTTHPEPTSTVAENISDHNNGYNKSIENNDQNIMETENNDPNFVFVLEESVSNDHEVSDNESSVSKSEPGFHDTSHFSNEGTIANDGFETQVSGNGINGSNENLLYEDAHDTKDDNDDIQTSPDTVSKDDCTFSNKISHFFGKWNSSGSVLEEDFQISSSKKLNTSTETKPYNHPYLSKVTGRPGIRERSNYSSFVSNKSAACTPKQKEPPLNDSFLVKSDPPRLIEINESTALRKFKGKRCLNSNDESEGEDVIVSSTKRQKLDDKSNGSGLLGTILWSPFKKKSGLDEDEPVKLASSQSKLFRFLSPFYFWKKANHTNL